MLKNGTPGHGRALRGYATSITMGLLAIATIASMALTLTPQPSLQVAPLAQPATSANGRDSNPGYSVTGEIDISGAHLPSPYVDD